MRGESLSGQGPSDSHPLIGTPLSDPLTHYVLIRADLPLGHMLAQTIHAAGESSPGDLPDHTYAIALACDDEAHLLDYEQRLIEAGIPHKTIREPDAPYNGAATALGIYPQPRSALKRHLRGLPLMK